MSRAGDQRGRRGAERHTDKGIARQRERRPFPGGGAPSAWPSAAPPRPAARARYNASTTCRARRSPIGHHVTATDRAPAASSGAVRPCKPSPRSTTPARRPAAGQDDQVRRELELCQFPGPRNPSSPSPGASARAVCVRAASSTSACVAKWRMRYGVSRVLLEPGGARLVPEQHSRGPPEDRPRRLAAAARAPGPDGPTASGMSD